jgi:hypothetical protein
VEQVNIMGLIIVRTGWDFPTIPHVLRSRYLHPHAYGTEQVRLPDGRLFPASVALPYVIGQVAAHDGHAS